MIFFICRRAKNMRVTAFILAPFFECLTAPRLEGIRLQPIRLDNLLSRLAEKKGEDVMEIRPLSPQLGAEVIGVDISQPLPDDVFKTIDDAYNHYSVLVFRGQKLTPEQQIAFSRLFGELEVSPRTQFALPGHPEILVLSNIIIDGKPIGNADAGTRTCPIRRRRRADRCSTPAKFQSRMGARSVTPYLPVPPLLTTRCRRR